MVDSSYEWLARHSSKLMIVFSLLLVAMNVWRLDEWGIDGFRSYFSHVIMQTTLFDFACILAIMTVFIHVDARKHGLSYWWILPTYPFMPTLGVLAYFIVRHHRARRAIDR